MKLKAKKIEKGNRWYEREDGLFFKVEFDEDYKVWTVWQVEGVGSEEVIYNDPRNGIGEEGHENYPRLRYALNSIRENG